MESKNAIVILMACLLFSSAASAQNASVATQDGLRLELSPAGRVTSLRIGPADLPMKGQGGFAIADFRNQPEPMNLVPNPGFEEGTKGWRLARGQALDTSVSHSGKASARLEVPGPAPASCNLEVIVPVKPNTRYRVGMCMRRQNVGVCGAYSSERDDRGKLSGKRTQVGPPSIPKQDGAWLPLSWEITTEPKTTRLSLRADIYRSTGTLWLDDFFINELNEGIYEPVEGRIEAETQGLAFRSALPQRGLELEATLKPDKECLRVDGVVKDTTGQDRAVGVKFALPLDFPGWTWYTDAEEREQIEPGRSYRHTYNCKSGIGRCSIYPWCALTGSQAGLTLALPLSQGPRVFLLQHDQVLAETSVIFFFGLAKDAGNNPSRAPFSFVIYSHDPAWGMRSAMQRYYRLFPESFVKRPTYEGYLNYAGMESFNPKNHQLVVDRGKGLDDASDFGEGYRFIWAIHGCYDFRQVPYDDPNLPKDDVVFSLLRGMIEAETAKPRYYVPSEETIKKIVFGPEGQISYIGDTKYWRPNEGYNHTDKAGWGFNFRVNEDPGVSPYVEEMSRRKAEEAAKAPDRRSWDCTFTADAIEGYMANTGGINYRREHFKTTLVPLTFGYGNLQPAMPNTIWDFHQKAWWPISQEYKIVTYGNSNGYEQVFTAPFVDVPMTEGSWDAKHPGRLDRYLRAIAYRKIWRHWHAWDDTGGYGEKEPANVRRHFPRCLSNAVYPAVTCIQSGSGDIEPYRALYRQYVPAIEELSVAGWDPVPHARASEGVVVERYGAYADGELHFTLRNYGDKPVDTKLALDNAALGIPQATDLVVMDILKKPGLLEEPGFSCRVDAEGTRAFWIGTREQAAQHGLRLAAAALEKLERFFYTEMSEASRDTWAKALKAAKDGAQSTTPAALVALSEQVQDLAGRLEQDLATKSSVDLAKLVYRVRVEASLAPVAVLGLESNADRAVENAIRGEVMNVAWTLRNGGPGGVTDLQARIVSPWREVAEKCQLSAAAPSLEKGGEVRLQAGLFVPADPPRRLMPYLLEIRAKASDAPFTVAVPVDVQVGTPLAVSVAPTRVFRGMERKIKVTVTSSLPENAKLTLQLKVPAKVKAAPDSIAFEIPGKGASEQPLTMVFDKNVTIGDLRIPYTVTSSDARFNVKGSFALLVGDPVPQLSIKRVPTPPHIDGKLDDPVWQSPPLIPELRLLANGGPATEKTAVWAAYDDNGLYVAMRCAESRMDEIVAKFVDRGSPLYQEDDVELFILPQGTQRVYQFAINPLGTRSDNFGDKADWKAAAQRGENEWTVEVFIPYSVMGLSQPPAAGLPWGMQFGRQRPHKPNRETTSWTPGQAFISKEGFGEILFE
jgi:hypothetical protein